MGHLGGMWWSVPLSPTPAEVGSTLAELAAALPVPVPQAHSLHEPVDVLCRQLEEPLKLITGPLQRGSGG